MRVIVLVLGLVLAALFSACGSQLHPDDVRAVGQTGTGTAVSGAGADVGGGTTTSVDGSSGGGGDVSTAGGSDGGTTSSTGGGTSSSGPPGWRPLPTWPTSTPAPTCAVAS